MQSKITTVIQIIKYVLCFSNNAILSKHNLIALLFASIIDSIYDYSKQMFYTCFISNVNVTTEFIKSIGLLF